MPSNAFNNVVLPALQSVIESKAIYRCERDLHHHLTSLFEAQCRDKGISLDIGSSNPRIEYEHPTKRKYRWIEGDGDEKSGNVDLYFFPMKSTDSWSDSQGVAIEVNYNYDDVAKITRDIIKLIDPDNGYIEPVYIACARKSHFHDRILEGVSQAIDWFRASIPNFEPPSGLFIFAMSEHGRSRDWRFYGPNTSPNDPLKKLKGEVVSIQLPVHTSQGELIDKETARKRLQNAMQSAGIGPGTRTAKCMFEPTTNSKGERICVFGSTPLWDRELPLVGECVLDSIFNEWIERLVESGRKRQGST